MRNARNALLPSLQYLSQNKQQLQKINQAEAEVLKNLSKAYYVAKSEPPLAKFSSFCKLQKANGLDLGSTHLLPLTSVEISDSGSDTD